MTAQLEHFGVVVGENPKFELPLVISNVVQEAFFFQNNFLYLIYISIVISVGNFFSDAKVARIKFTTILICTCLTLKF